MELTVCDEVSEEKIFTPKARRMFPKKKNLKDKYHPMMIILSLIQLKVQL